MNIGFYSARSGLIAMQQGLDVISNNVANVQTNGYKDIRPSFSDLLYSTQKPQNPEAQTGHGTKLSKTDLMYERGQLMMTNRDLDFSTPTDCFFAVMDASGNISYTKDGAFYMSNNGTGWDLVNADGKFVLGYDKQPIRVNIDAEGNPDIGDIQQRLGTFRFDNPYGLLANGSNTYLATESSGEGIADTNADKLMGTLEMSTVDIGDQMVKVIQYQRGFQLNSKMVQTADEIQSIVNNLR